MALCVLGFALSGYLSWHYLQGGTMLGCGGGSPCDDVLNSRWSAIGGVLPVSGLAASAYLAMLVCSLSIGAGTAAPIRRLAWRALVVLATAAAGSAVWFTIVQKWFIGAWCPYCMATHLTSLAVAALVIWRAPRLCEARNLGTSEPPPFASRLSPFVLAGFALAVLLVAAQIGLTSARTYWAGKSQNATAGVDAHAVPVVGSPDARYVVVLFFDYQCPHCQQLHLMLGEAIRRYRGQLAFALCPAPLNRACNPYVPRDTDEFKDSCELTRIALAVWAASRAAFPAFDDWMYSFDSGDRWRPRTLEAATAKAIALVGRAKFEAARNDPSIDRALQLSIRRYGETMQNGRGGVPKLAFGDRWVLPQPSTADDLVSILQDSLGVPAP